MTLHGARVCRPLLASWAPLALVCASCRATAINRRERDANWTWSGGSLSYGDVDARYFKNFIVVPELKLLFCTIEKAGDMTFNTLFRMIRSRYDPSQLEGHVWRRNAPVAFNYTNKVIIDAILDPAWHKAVFVREPLERYVSAYLSKCHNTDPDGYKHCRNQFGKEHINFEDTVRWMKDFDMSNRSDADVDAHFMKQVQFCGGLGETLHHYQTVEQLDRTTSFRKVSEMLRKVGVDVEHIDGFTNLFPPPGNTSWEVEQHNTNAQSAIQQYIGNRPQWVKDVLFHHYAEDYKAFNIPRPAL